MNVRCYIGSLLIDPVQSWDAIVCTSSVVKKTLERVVGEYADYLKERIGVRPKLSVQLPVIPLGVDCEQFCTAEGEKYRRVWREKLGIATDDIAVLYVGRLNFTAKAHPLPMFLALEEAARRSGKKVWLLLAGWFDPPASEKLWREDVQRFCPSVQTVFLDGRQEDVRREIWSAADIFTSLSDNIQETFGLTPIEAMAAGLPVVVTDWDGYRDTVRHGIDGFRVPVVMAEPGMGEELAVRFANKFDSYGKYCGSVSQMTSVDTNACFMAYIKLIEDGELRRKMGEAGRQRAWAEYDWRNIVGKYRQLWEHLADIRTCDGEVAPTIQGKPAMPLRMDPFTLFQEYPTGHITDDCVIMIQCGKMKGWWEHIVSSTMNKFILMDEKLLLTKEEQSVIIKHLMSSEKAFVVDIANLFPKERNRTVRRTIAWMAKTSMIRITKK